MRYDSGKPELKPSMAVEAAAGQMNNDDDQDEADEPKKRVRSPAGARGRSGLQPIFLILHPASVGCESTRLVDRQRCGNYEYEDRGSSVRKELNAQSRELSAHTMANIRQNLFFAFVYNVVGVPVAAGVLYPFFGVLLSPIIAAAAMSLSSVSVIANALRLRKA